MTAQVFEATLVGEIGEGLVQVHSPAISQLQPGAAIELKVGGAAHHYLGTVLAVQEDNHVKVLLDAAAMTEQEAAVEDVDDALGGLPDDVPPIQGMIR